MDRAPITRGFRVALYAVLPLALLVLLYADRRQWFFYDDWEFLATRGLGGQPLDLFRPHNAHWSTIPILVYRALYALVGIHSYIPYLLTLLFLHIATAYVLWRAMLRLGADGWIATALATVFLLLGAGYQNLTWGFQSGLIAPLLFGLLAALLVDCPARGFGRRDILVWLLAVGGLMCSAIGIVMVGFLGIVALLRRGWRAALITVSVPATVYVAWLLAVGRHALLADTTVNAQTLLAIPDFAWAGLTATIDQTTGLVGAGAIAILGLTAWMILRRREAMAQSIAFAGAIAAAGFFLLDGIGRAAEGIAAASASRDLYVEAALLLPIAAVVMSRLAQRARVQQLVLLGLTGFALVHGVNVLFDQTRMLGPIKQQEEQQILAGAALIRGGATVIGTHPDVRWASDLTTRDLAFMVREGSVPTDVGVSSANRLNARLALQVVAGSPPLVDHTSTVMLSMNGQGTATLGADGCVTTTAEGAVGVTLRFAGDGWVSVRSSAGGALVARLAASDAISDSLTLDRLAPGTTDYISDTTPADQLLLLLPPGTTTLCGDIQLQSP